jgi:hypothetical protein
MKITDRIQKRMLSGSPVTFERTAPLALSPETVT